MKRLLASLLLVLTLGPSVSALSLLPCRVPIMDQARAAETREEEPAEEDGRKERRHGDREQSARDAVARTPGQINDRLTAIERRLEQGEQRPRPTRPVPNPPKP